MQNAMSYTYIPLRTFCKKRATVLESLHIRKRCFLPGGGGFAPICVISPAHHPYMCPIHFSEGAADEADIGWIVQQV